jgi:predicted permease
MFDSTHATRFRFWLWLVRMIGVIVPRRLRADWRQEWEAELRCREAMLEDWDKLGWRSRLDLLRRSTGAFWDALWLQQLRLEDEMIQDLRYSIRMLWKNPGFSLVVVLTLGLGIGVNVALFSVVNGVLLNPLPYPEPDQLVTLHQSKPNFETGAIPYPNFRDWQTENKSFSAMAIFRPAGFTLIGAGEPQRVNARFVSAQFFDVLGVRPVLGRTFAPGEDERGAAPVVLISQSLWHNKLGATPDVLEKNVTLDDRSYAVIGVIPAGFNLVRGVDVYVPIGQWSNPALRSRAAALGLHGIGRLNPGLSAAQGEADLDKIMHDLAAAYPDTNRGNEAKVVPLRQRLVGPIEPTLLMLFGAVGCVLLIACVNVSNLLLARSIGRTREFALRSALGAGQLRLIRQSLTESTVLAVAGGALGLAIAGWGTQAALAALPTALPRAGDIGIDFRVLVFTAAVSLATGVLCGMAPALKISRWRLSESLKEGGRGVSGGKARAQGIFVAVQMALALVLLIGAGLMIRSLSALWEVDPGFRPNNLLAFGLSLSPSMRSATDDARRAMLREMSDRLNSTPGITAASFSSGALPLMDEDDLFFWLDNQPKPPSQSEMSMALIYRVEPAYLAAMGIPLRKGRFFTDQDNEASRPVAVIDEVFARQHFGDDDPIGRRVHIGDDEPPLEIVGIVGHVNQWSIDSNDALELQAQLYEPFRRLRGPAGATVVVRFEGSAGTGPVLQSIRSVVQSANSENVIFNPQTMEEVITGSLADRRFSMMVLGTFALGALLLAGLGIYGVISYLVGTRTHELGVRLALGAKPADILRLVLGHGMKMAVSGVAIGLAAAFGLTGLLGEMLYGVSPTDPVTFSMIALLLSAVALLACFIPARRATRVDPLAALREE